MNNTLKKEWHILYQLVTRDFKLKYRRSVLGVAWSVLNPLLMMIVMAAVFSYMFRFDIPYFPLYLILGNTLFSFMSEITTNCMSSVLDSAPLIKKIRINKILFPVNKALSALVNFAISLIAVALVVLWFRIAPTPVILLTPILVVLVFVFALGIGMLLAALAVFFRDTIHIWSVFITAWTYATPLFYPVSILDGWMLKVMMFNPMYHYVTFFRDIVMYGALPSFSTAAVCVISALVAFLVGLIVFRKVENKFILYV